MADVLLIDDDDCIRRVLRLWLEALGHSVREASDGVQGLELFREEQPEIVLADLLLRDNEGLELVSELRGVDPDARVVAMSGGKFLLGGQQCLSNALSLGAAATLQKPFRRAELEEALSTALAT